MRTKVVYLFVVLAICLATSWSFLGSQELWTDEMTQLSGQSLDSTMLLHWLLHHEPDLGVDADAMPPGSHFVGKAWAALGGAGVIEQRALGMLVVAIAAGWLFLALQKHYGTPAAMLCGLLFALSPNLTVISVEIRSYPLFLLCSVAALSCYLDMWRYGRGLRGLVAALSLACWFHFYGFVLAWAMFPPLFLRYWTDSATRYRLIWAGSVFVLLVVGVAPFILAAFEKPSGVDPVSAVKSAHRLARLGYRLVAHASMTIVPLVVAVGLGAALVLIVSAWSRRRKLGDLFWAPAACLAFGGGAVVVATFAISGFRAATPSYSVWMVPPLLALWAGPIRGGSLARCAAVVLVAAYCFGAIQLARHGSGFAHGPFEQVASVIAKQDKRVAIVHSADSGRARMTYVAIRYLGQNAHDQYKLTLTGGLHRMVDGDPVDISFLNRYDKVVFVRSVAMGHRQLVAGLRRQAFSQVAVDLPSSLAGWSVIQENSFMAWTAIHLKVLSK